MFILKIKNLQALTVLGIYDWEKESKRLVILNIEMHVVDYKAGDTDTIKDAIDYSLIEQSIVQRLETASYHLLERLVKDIAQCILSLDARIAKVSVEADKPGALRQADSVSVSLTLDRKSLA